MIEKTKASYRRYIPGKISLVDKTPSIFSGKVEQGKDYQDLLSYVETSEYGDLLVDTIGMRNYIENKTINIFFDRMMLLLVNDGEIYIKNRVLRKGDFYIILPNFAIIEIINDKVEIIKRKENFSLLPEFGKREGVPYSRRKIYETFYCYPVGGSACIDGAFWLC